jgi:hypothetical protein
MIESSIVKGTMIGKANQATLPLAPFQCPYNDFLSTLLSENEPTSSNVNNVIVVLGIS